MAAPQRPIKSAVSNDQAAAGGDHRVWILGTLVCQAIGSVIEGQVGGKRATVAEEFPVRSRWAMIGKVDLIASGQGRY